jgi:DNA-binding transcriptional LysR family regulator
VVLDSLGALSAFVRAAETRSFTEAGRQLGVSSSAIGKAVARLEDRLGVRLLHRSTRSITLTAEGKVFLESCRRIFSEIETVELEFAQSKGTPKGKLKVSLPHVEILIPALSRFIRAYPAIELDMDFTDHLVDVIEDGYDVVLRTGDGADSRLVARTLGTYRLEVVGSLVYFAKAGLPSTPDDLAGHSCLHHKFPTTGKLQRWPFLRTASGTGISLPVTAASSTVEPLVALAEDGHGIACVPDFAIRKQIADGSLMVVLSEYIEQAKPMRAVWLSSRYLSPKVKVFVDFMADHLFRPMSPAPKRRTPGRATVTARQSRSQNPHAGNGGLRNHR